MPVLITVSKNEDCFQLLEMQPSTPLLECSCSLLLEVGERCRDNEADILLFFVNWFGEKSNC